MKRLVIILSILLCSCVAFGMAALHSVDVPDIVVKDVDKKKKTFKVEWKGSTEKYKDKQKEVKKGDYTLKFVKAKEGVYLHLYHKDYEEPVYTYREVKLK